MRVESSEVNLSCAVVRVRGAERESKKRKRKRSESEAKAKTRKISGGNGKRDPPVPIPNTEVKPLSADGTWLETARKSRSLPDSKHTA